MRLTTLFAICVGIFGAWFIWYSYENPHGYTKEQRKTIDRLFEDNDHTTSGMLQHLSVADIQLDAEQFMSEVR